MHDANAATAVALHWELPSKMKLGWLNATPPFTPKSLYSGNQFGQLVLVFLAHLLTISPPKPPWLDSKLENVVSP